MHTINRCTDYTPIGTTYAQAFKRPLAKGKIDLLKIRPENEGTRQVKNFDPTKYYKHCRARDQATAFA